MNPGEGVKKDQEVLVRMALMGLYCDDLPDCLSTCSASINKMGPTSPALCYKNKQL